MARSFNVTGACDSQLHYMVDITGRLEKIKALIDNGDYFTINRARQYGKTTTIGALADFLKSDYFVVSMDFQDIGAEEFENARVFSAAFSECFLQVIQDTDDLNAVDRDVLEELSAASKDPKSFSLRKLFVILSKLCGTAKKRIVLIIDEVDSAANNQVFLDFLAQLRSYYLKRSKRPTFQSVILAGVVDVKNIKMKLRPEADHKVNSPWNIATDFLVDMSFSVADIRGMLSQYEEDHRTGMDTEMIAELLYSYTSGYPFLVSRLCQLMDERIVGTEAFPDRASAWTKSGFLEAVKLLLSEKNTLFDSLMGKLYDYPELKQTVYGILFGGNKIVYNPDEHWMDVAMMFGFARNDSGTLAIANRIFEVRLYNYFLATTEAQSSEIFKAAAQNKSQFIHLGHLDMRLLLEKFVTHFDQIYGDSRETFDEDEGRRRFLLFLRPIINGTGNYYIEPETRNSRRMDVVVDYLGEQFIIELKIWRGNAYNGRGEKQLSDYLDYFHLKKGYMLSYNFNQEKEIGVKEIAIGDRILVEAVV